MFNTLLMGNHRYSLASTGLKFKSREFLTRRDAEREMYKSLKKNHISVVEIYDDKHYKTYRCTNGVNFYISRI